MKLESVGLAVVLLFAFGVVSIQFVQPAHATISPVHVKVVDFAFAPSNIRVVIGVNNTVIWSNNGTADHTVTSNGGKFDSGTLTPGHTFEFTFSTPGTYDYHCSIHSSMKGTVVVVSKASTTTASSSTSSGSGSGIPEFPVQLGFTLVATVAIVTSYVLARRVMSPRQ
jgi:plastocyanin